MEIFLILIVVVLPPCVLTFILARVVAPMAVWAMYTLAMGYVLWVLYQTWYTRNGMFMEIEIPMSAILLLSMAAWALWCKGCIRWVRSRRANNEN